MPKFSEERKGKPGGEKVRKKDHDRREKRERG